MDRSERMRRLAEPVESLAQSVARQVIELVVRVVREDGARAEVWRAARLRFLSRDSPSAPAGP